MAQNYSSAQILAMQNDAIKRVQEMQKLAKQQVSRTTNNTPDNNPPPSQINELPPILNDVANFSPPNTYGFQQPLEVVKNGFEGILEKLNLDDEKLILILLIILLINEGDDIMLILALGYILLTG